MGHGSYKASDWAKLKESRGIAASSSAGQLFSRKSMLDKFNPKFIQMRESCDSEDSPESTPIIIGFDVTGSMGYLAAEIAKNALNETIVNIYNKKPVTNPHIMCAAIGDVCDQAPLQVTQFEADIRVVEQLLDLWLEGAGGDYPENFNLLWYFADKHTKIDSYINRNKKGFLFTIGDAETHPNLSALSISKIFGDQSQDLDNQQLLQAVSEKYEVFHIVVRDTRAIAHWNSIIPGRVAYLSAENISNLSAVITSIMQIANGMSKQDAIGQWPAKTNAAVAQAVETIHLDKVQPKPSLKPKVKAEVEAPAKPEPVAKVEVPAKPIAKERTFLSKLFNK